MERVVANPTDIDVERPAGWRRGLDLWWLVSTAGLAALLVFFASVHFSQWLATGRPVGLGLMAQETLSALLFVIRRRARGTSSDPVAWVATVLGSFGMFAVWPSPAPLFGLSPLYTALQFVGVTGALLSLSSLGRSFGLVAANRGVQTGGMYTLVRHQIYQLHGYLPGLSVGEPDTAQSRRSSWS
ncbi:MAG: hypothetical protein U0531_21655 [Dehalococcoidia bacterium]